MMRPKIVGDKHSRQVVPQHVLRVFQEFLLDLRKFRRFIMSMLEEVLLAPHCVNGELSIAFEGFREARALYITKQYLQVVNEVRTPHIIHHQFNFRENPGEKWELVSERIGDNSVLLIRIQTDLIPLGYC